MTAHREPGTDDSVPALLHGQPHRNSERATTVIVGCYRREDAPISPVHIHSHPAVRGRMQRCHRPRSGAGTADARGARRAACGSGPSSGTRTTTPNRPWPRLIVKRNSYGSQVEFNRFGEGSIGR
jgi:hypothetical protein